MIQPIVITMGDPAGVGPEIIEALCIAREGHDIVVIGDPHMLPSLPVIDSMDAYKGGVAILARPCAHLPVSAKADLENAPAIVGWIEEAVALVRSGRARAIVTAPINKDVLASGTDFKDPGHTEFLARLDGAKRPIMLLASDALKVVPATIHIAIADVPTQLSPALLEETIRVTHSEFARLGVPNARIAVAGLNPHAGENGRMGNEELTWINALLASLKAEGMQITGPLPADTMFHERARKTYDVAICMYHDQALIPIKTLAFDSGVNVTLGLSFLRTSPDHGTAFDIAGKGIALPHSMIAAYDLAHKGHL